MLKNDSVLIAINTNVDSRINSQIKLNIQLSILSHTFNHIISFDSIYRTNSIYKVRTEWRFKSIQNDVKTDVL